MQKPAPKPLVANTPVL